MQLDALKNLRTAVSLTFNPDPPYLVKRWFGAGQTSIVYGPSNVGKSFFVLDLIYHIVTDSEWHGNKVQHGRVVYVATEGHSGIAKRIHALERVYGFPNNFVPEDYLILPERVNLTDPNFAQEFCARFIAKPVDLVVVDTLAAALGQESENLPETVNMLLGNLRPLQEAHDTHIMLVHHTGKDETRGLRGSSAWKASVDTEIELQEKGGEIHVLQTKQRDHDKSQVLRFVLEPIVLAQDRDGEDVTSCVIRFSGFAKPTTKLTKDHRILLAHFEMLEKQATFEQPSLLGIPDGVQAVQLGDWKASVIADPTFRPPSVKYDSKRKAFERGVDKLVQMGLVKAHHQTFWRPLLEAENITS